MTEPIDVTEYARKRGGAEEPAERKEGKTPGVPSNPVYARVGETVLLAVREKVRRGVRPEDIIREVVTEHGVRLNLAELHLLLASRRVPE